MKLPHQNYIRFLITSGLDHKETVDHLEELNLPSCDVEYWNYQYEALHEVSLPKKIKKFWRSPKPKLPKGFFEYMSVVDLKEAWQYNCGKNKYFKVAVDAAADPQITIILNALLAGKSQKEELSAIINGKFAMPFPKEAVALYEKYFFNPKIMDRKSWKLYLRSLTNSEERQLIYLGIMGEEQELRAELGIPTKISVSENYQKLHVFAMNKFNTYRSAQDPEADKEALKWAKLAMSSGDKYEKLKVSDATDFVRDIQMEFEYIDTNFPTIGQSDLEEIKSEKDAGQNNDNAEPIPMREESNEA